VQVATTDSVKPGLLTRMGSIFGLQTPEPAAPSQPSANPPTKPKVAAKPAATRPQAPPKSEQQIAEVQSAKPGSSPDSVINGAVAPLPTGTFDGRFGGR
jgi:hypothetical protein